MGSDFDIATLDACFGEAPDPITVHDRAGGCVYSNAAAERWLARGRKELWGRTLGELDVAFAAQLAQLHLDVLESGEPRAIELEQASGARWLEHRASPVRDPLGRPIGVTTISRDVTGRKRSERMQAMLAEIGKVTIEAEALPTMVERIAATLCPFLGDGAQVVLHAEDGPGALVIATPDHELRALLSDRAQVLALPASHLLSIPLVARGRPLGVLAIVRRARRRPFDDADRDLAGELARRVSLAIDHARLHAALERTEATLQRSRDALQADAEAKTELLLREQAARAALREALQRLTFHVENSPLGVIEWNRDFRVVGWSRGAEALFGWSAGEVLGKHPDEWPFVHASDVEAVRHEVERLLSGAEPRRVTTGRYHRKDSEVVHCDWYHSALTDESGAAVSVLSLVLDATPRVLAQREHERRLEAEQAARAQAELERARFLRLLQNAPALVAILSGPDHVYEFVNERFCETIPDGRALVGTSARRRSAMGSRGTPERTDLVHQHFVSLLDQVYETGDPYETGEVPLARETPEGAEVVYLTFIYQPIRRTDGSIEGIASFAFDVSESVLARKEVEEASRAKDEFLSTLSHELRTPLNAIVGWSHLLRTGALEDVQAMRALEAIDRNARMQKRLIDDLLDFARLVSGKLGLHLAALDLAQVVTNAIESLRPSLDAKRVTCSLRVLSRAIIYGDPDRLQQVVANLLSNAVKFTAPRGHIDVTVAVAGEFAELVVRDDGLGIDAQFLPHVFERFRQADSSSTRRYGGLGLGLAIARSIVEMHGGSIHAESEGLGRGATMRIHLPLCEDEDGPIYAERKLTSVVARAQLAGMRALVVDDEEDARTLVDAVLRRAGAEVTLAKSADEALDVLHAEDIDVLISDLGMPELDGIGLIERVRALPGPLSRVPAVAVTAYARTEDRDRAVSAGYDAFLTKPIDVDELTSVVARAVGRGLPDVQSA